MERSDSDRRSGRWVVVVLIAFVLLIPFAIGIIAHRYLHRAVEPPATVSPRPVAPLPTPTPRQVSLQPTVAPRADLPRLDASDAFMRKLAAALSTNPQWAKWLLTEGVVRQLVASTDNIAEGRSPNPHLGFLAPKQPFRATERSEAPTIDAATFHRYDLVADVIASLDAKGCARVFEETRPLFQDAYKELGYPDRKFEDTLAKAIRHLLATPEPPTAPSVRPSVKSWKLADPRLEALSPAQKQLLRMGPENVKKIKQKLRELAEAMNLAVS
jgi:hypothetical protein